MSTEARISDLEEESRLAKRTELQQPAELRQRTQCNVCLCPDTNGKDGKGKNVVGIKIKSPKFGKKT